MKNRTENISVRYRPQHLTKSHKKALAYASAFNLTSNYLTSQVVSNQVLSACIGLTTVFGMGTGGTTWLSSPDYFVEMFSQN